MLHGRDLPYHSAKASVRGLLLSLIAIEDEHVLARNTRVQWRRESNRGAQTRIGRIRRGGGDIEVPLGIRNGFSLTVLRVVIERKSAGQCVGPPVGDPERRRIVRIVDQIDRAAEEVIDESG